MGDRTVKVYLKGDVGDYLRSLATADAATKGFSGTLNESNGRMHTLVQTSLALAPALVPIGAAAVPAIAGLSNQLAFAAAGAGVAALAFSGVGRALKATNDYAIEPSAANFEKLQRALDTLGPAGREFVGFLQELRPQLQGLQDAAQAGLFPGVESGIRDLMTLLPQAERIVSGVASGLGQVIAEAGANLADPRWQDFFTFLETEAKPTLVTMGRTIGNFAEGFANLWMAFDPLSDSFSKSFLQMSRDFASWTDGLSQTEGFQEFVDYITTNGPRAWDALSAIGNALLQIVEAAAPIGAATLPVIEALSDAIAALADSDLGPIIVGVVALTAAFGRLKAIGVASQSGLFGKSAYGGALTAAKDLPRALLQYDAAAGRAQAHVGQLAMMTGRLGTAMRGTAKLAGGAGGLAFIMSDLDDKMGLTNTAMGAMIGSTIGPWGTAVGAASGLVIDLTHQTDQAADSVKRFDDAFAGAQSIEQQAAVIAEYKKQLEQVKAAQDAIGDGPGGKLGDAAKKLEDGLKPLEEQYAANVRAAQDAQLAEAGLGDAMAGASDEARGETLALLDAIQAKNASADAAESAFDAETNWRQALKDARKQAASNSAGIDGMSDAAIRNRQVITNLSGAWNRQADAGGKTTAQMKKAQAQFIAVAIGMGVSAKRARQLADELFHIPKNTSPNVRLDGAQRAIMQAQQLAYAIANIKSKSVTITYAEIHEHQAQAKDGGYIRRFADGGTHNGLVHGPGGPRDDLIPAMISNGEFVVNAAATKKNLGLLFEINAQKYANGGQPGRLQSFAAGGQPMPTFGLPATADSHALAATMTAAAVLEQIELRVELGASNRTKASWYIDGKKFAGRLDG